MKKEVLTYLVIGYGILMTVAVVYLCFQSRDLVINYPDVKTSTIEYHPVFYIFELPRHKVDVITVYKDKENNEHQVYADTINYVTDSLEVSFVNNVDVDIVKRKAIFTREDFKIKMYEKVVTQIVEAPKEITKYANNPFYRNNWFWAWFGETLSIIGIAIIAIFL